MGVEGRAELLRESVKSLDIPVDNVVPDRDTIIKNTKLAAMQQMAALTDQSGGNPAATDAAGGPAGGQNASIF